MLEIFGFIVLVGIGVWTGIVLFAMSMMIFRLGVGGGFADKLLTIFLIIGWCGYVWFVFTMAPFTIVMATV
jgi:hypothetical protein